MRWASTCLILIAALAGSAGADEQAQPAGNGQESLPGVGRVGIPSPMRGVSLAIVAGYGFTESVLQMSDSHHRAAARLAASYAPLSWLAFGIRVDTRWDRHDLGATSDQSFTSDPRVTVRAIRALSDRLSLGAQLQLWVPGESPTSFTIDAASVDGILLASYEFAPRLVVAANAGFRIDRSANSIETPAGVSDADRLALGLSDSNAVLAGLGATYALGRRRQLELLGEWSWDLLVGGAAPSLSSAPMRLSAGVRWHVSHATSVSTQVDVAPSRRPVLDRTQPLVPIEPLLTMSVGINVRFGADPPSAPDVSLELATKPGASPGRSLRGVVRGQDGPIPDASVEITAGTRVQLLTTDASGAFGSGPLEGDSAQVTVTAEGHGSRTTTVTLQDGLAVDIDVKLAASVRTGQLRGLVASYAGAPLIATIAVGDQKQSTDADGAFRIELPTGVHVVTITADGYQTQTREVTIEADGVTLLNADLRRTSK